MTENDDARFPPAPVILLTGANGAVGLGISLRLLHQLSQPNQADVSRCNVGDCSPGTKPACFTVGGYEEEDFQSAYATPNGLTLLLGCRSRTKAEDARATLLRRLKRLFAKESADDQVVSAYTFIDRVTGQVETISFEIYRQRWLANLRIEFLELDLSDLSSIFRAVDVLKQRYGYISHLLLNAGGAAFIGLDWPKAIRGFCRNFLEAVTFPDYMLEGRSTETNDKLGHTWQLNVFGHYLLARLSLPLLSRAPTLGPARIIWTSSLDGMAKFFEPRDYQCLESLQGYKSTKYQVGLLGWAFNSVIQAHEAAAKKEKEMSGPQLVAPAAIHSLVAHPGIVAGNMFAHIIGVVLNYVMLIVFYFTRTILGSPHHVASPYKAGLVWTFASLGASPTDLLHGPSVQADVNQRPFRLGARCDRLGSEYVALEYSDEGQVDQRWFDQAHAEHLLDRCDQLYTVHARKHRIDTITKPT
ncbi:hypothetical protein CROQUDRAFT_73125 [Cronartium quercuum f. sp. fusiforme G11]|uniref:3-keto-steroid reductase n=1 Tax=Cronartium quercuum f. sp. fusiforme G11 TaxID=708437 RepID=A0A9P6NNB3_9BASI|nr:hypothetical protein CROQUDRAFT_73125 [Cronartium quercuum f. sp. fusiforme G11]